jgi:hypothetical protein
MESKQSQRQQRMLQTGGRQTRTSDETLSKRPLLSHSDSADMEDKETLDAPVGHGIKDV